MTKKKPPPLREWEVTYGDGQKMALKAHYVFDNRGENGGLVFRRIDENDKDQRTYIVASFATYTYFKEMS